MKIAIFHQFLDNIGGAEIVAFILARELNADIYTTNVNREKIAKMGFSDVLFRIKSIGKIPINAPFRHQLALFRFRLLNLGRKYDFYIISGDWAVSGAVNNKPNLWYVFSPLNELWQFKDFIRQNVLSLWKRPLYDIFVLFNRRLTLRYAKHVQKWVCISKNTQNRTKKYYKKDSVIINPPTDCSKYYYKKDKGYWLSVNRLITHKRIELQMRAFAKMPDKRLIIVGSYEKGARQFESYRRYLEGIKPKNAEIINWVDDETLKKLYSECKGLITTAKDEDFGMTPVEAMASGKPVIAGNEGGYKETVINGKTGILIDDINEDKIIEAVKIVEKNPVKYRKECQKRARDFDIIKFIEKIKIEIRKNITEVY